jgi:8-oxo-dGTP pyrophosphatase MutT (NUDIX family)
MPDEARRRIGKALAAHAPKRLPEEALDARAAVTLVFRPTAATAGSQAASGGRRATRGDTEISGGTEISEVLAAELLFVQRAVVERDPWSGHMALPGGRRDPTDADLVETALRELQEETTLELEPSDVIGRLDEVAPGNPALPAIGITPFVAWHDSGTGVRSSAEVRDHVWVPLPVLLDDGYRSVLELQDHGQLREFPTIEFRGYTIWGLTYRIIMDFLALLDSSVDS